MRWKNRPEGSNWGDFGPDDQVGRLNLLTPEKVRQGVAEVRDGRSWCLSLPLDYPGGNLLHPARFPPVRAATQMPDGDNRAIFRLGETNPDLTDVVNDDRVLICTQYSTQWDSLAHVGGLFDADGDGVDEAVFYNGWRAGEHIVAGKHQHADDMPAPGCGEIEGVDAHRLGIETMAETCVQGRAVLIDIRSALGDDFVDVGFDTLERIMTDQNVVVEEGDMVLLHTGYADRVLDMKREPDPEVLHGVCAALNGRDEALQNWVRGSGLAALIADNYAVERAPNTSGEGRRATLPLHELCLFKLGIPLGEIWHLTPLAAHLRAEGRNRFLLTAPPLRLPGAVGFSRHAGRHHMTTLEDLLYPESVAVVGASDDPTRIGGRPLAYFLNQGFGGAIWPVNPRRETVQGLKSYPSVTDLPGRPDFVLIAVPAPLVIGVVEEAALKGAKAVMIFSSGFAEESEAGAAMQARLTRIARESGIRIVGPNCLGVFNSAHNFYATFTGTISMQTPVPGGVSIASQSGAYGSHISHVANRRGLGIRYWITSGNECDVNTAEAIGLLVRSDHVHTVMAYAESIKDGPALISALDDARAERKPVIFMKVGRTEIGAAAANSHTASLAGEDEVYDAILRQYGSYRAGTTEEMLDVAYACRPRIYPAGRKVGIVTISGGAGVLMGDAAHERGLDVAEMPEAAQTRLKELVPFAAPRNPVDVTAQFFNDMSLVPKFTEAMLDQGGYDALLGFWTSVAGNPNLSGKLIAGLMEVMEGRDTTLFIQSLIAPDEVTAQYEDAGFPCFEDPTRAVAAMAALCFLGSSFAAGAPDRPAVPAADPLPKGVLNEVEAKAILAEAGLPMVEDVLATDAGQAAEAAASAGVPVAMKIVSPDIQHKTEAGGVALGVAPDEAAETHERLIANAHAYAPTARIDGVMVSPMVEDGVEMIFGARIDPVFGPVVLAGLGGVFTEVLKDVAFRAAPVSPATAREMVEELQGVALLKGARGGPPANIDAVAEAISRLSVFAAAHAAQLDSVEMNPVRALPDRCVALDALIVKREGADGT